MRYSGTSRANPSASLLAYKCSALCRLASPALDAALSRGDALPVDKFVVPSANGCLLKPSRRSRLMISRLSRSNELAPTQDETLLPHCGTAKCGSSLRAAERSVSLTPA